MRDQAWLRRWSMGGATGPKLSKVCSMARDEERKTTLKMKSHRIWKPIQVAAGQSIKITTIL